MLGIDINCKIDLTNDKRKKYPLIFSSNICTSCGAEGTLTFIDKLGNPVRNIEVYPFSHIVCSKCGALYGIKWDKDKDGHMSPLAVDPKLKDRFFNCLGKNIQNIKSDIKNIL